MRFTAADIADVRWSPSTGAARRTCAIVLYSAAAGRYSHCMLNALDAHLLNTTPRQRLRGWPRFLTEFLYFGIKEARSCLFVGLFFAAVFLVVSSGCKLIHSSD